MSEPVVETVPDPTATPSTSEGMSEQELEGVIGRVIDARIAPLQDSIARIQVSPLDVDGLRAGILEDITSALSTHSGNGVDENKLTQAIGSMLDSKLKSIGVRTGRKPGPLSSWLGFGA